MINLNSQGQQSHSVMARIPDKEPNAVLLREIGAIFIIPDINGILHV